MSDAGDTRSCPYCAEEIRTAAIKCKHCGEFLDPGVATPSRAGSPPTPSALSNESVRVDPSPTSPRFHMQPITLFLVIVIGVFVAIIGYRVFETWLRRQQQEQEVQQMRDAARKYQEETNRVLPQWAGGTARKATPRIPTASTTTAGPTAQQAAYERAVKEKLEREMRALQAAQSATATTGTPAAGSSTATTGSAPR